SGAVKLDGSGVHVERIQLAAVGGRARVDGNYVFATATGQLDVDWTDVVTGMVTHSGTLQGTLTAPFPDRPRVQATLTTHGVMRDGPFDAQFVLDGTGRRGWGEVDWTLNT